MESLLYCIFPEPICLHRQENIRLLLFFYSPSEVQIHRFVNRRENGKERFFLVMNFVLKRRLLNLIPYVRIQFETVALENCTSYEVKKDFV